MVIIKSKKTSNVIFKEEKMRKNFMSICLMLLIVLVFSSGVYASEWVNGYYRSNGTYVQGYWRSSPDGNPYNNYSYPGNYNLYTGKMAKGNQQTYLNHYYNKPSTTYGTYPKPRYGTYSSSYSIYSKPIYGKYSSPYSTYPKHTYFKY